MNRLDRARAEVDRIGLALDVARDQTAAYRRLVTDAEGYAREHILLAENYENRLAKDFKGAIDERHAALLAALGRLRGRRAGL